MLPTKHQSWTLEFARISRLASGETMRTAPLPARSMYSLRASVTARSPPLAAARCRAHNKCTPALDRIAREAGQRRARSRHTAHQSGEPRNSDADATASMGYVRVELFAA